MQQVIACSNRGFAFGEPEKSMSRNYNDLLTEDCLSLWRVRQLIKPRKYGYRCKLLWDGIASFVQDAEKLNDRYYARQLLVALVVISNGPLFIDIRGYDYVRDGGTELKRAHGSTHLQFYIPSTGTSGFVKAVTYLLFETLLTRNIMMIRPSPVCLASHRKSV